jgi:predicted kinase
MEPRPLDRLDRRLAARRLRGRHLRALGRALAALRAEEGPAASAGAVARGALSCRDVFVGKGRRVELAAPAARVTTEQVAALVRELAALGAARRAEQLAAAYAAAADDYALYRRLDPLPGEPLVIATGGRVASGKSTLAKAVARRLAAPRVVADRVRRALLTELPDGSGHELAWAHEFGERVYAGLLARAGDVLAGRRPVVLDACFPTAARRAAAAALAARSGARFVFAYCDAPASDIAARLRLRDVRDGAAPGGWEKIARELEMQWEPPRRGEPGRLVRIDTSRPRGAWLRALGLPKRKQEGA